MDDEPTTTTPPNDQHHVRARESGDTGAAADARTGARAGALLGELLDAVDAPVLAFSWSGRCVAANGAAARAFGVDLDQLVGMDIHRVVADADAPAIVDAARTAVLEHGRELRVEMPIVGHAGAAFRLGATLRAVDPTGSGDPRRGLVMATLHTVDPANAAADGLRHARSLQGEVLDVLPMPVLVESGGAIVFANPAAKALFGVTTLGALQERERARAHVRHAEVALVEARRSAVARGESVPSPVEYHIVRPDGTERTVEWSTLPVEFGGEPARLLAASDVTDIADARDSLAASEERLRNITTGAPVGIFETDREGRCVFVNPRWCELTGLSPEQAAGSGWEEAIDPVELDEVLATWHARAAAGVRFSMEVRFRRMDGSRCSSLCVCQPLHDATGNVTGWIGTVTDLTEQHLVRAHLQSLANRDPLTGLLNRRALVSALDQRAARDDVSVLFCDIDGFKEVNDVHGHSVGDDVLVTAATRIAGCAGPADLVARFAGDEFVLVVERARAEDVARKLLQAFRAPVESGPFCVVLGLSVGMATSSRRERGDALEVLRRADQAMYRAKRAGKGTAVAA